MHTVAVRYGYLADGEDPAAWRPDAIVGAPGDLLAFLAPGAGD